MQKHLSLYPIEAAYMLIMMLFLSACEEVSIIDMDLETQQQLVVTGFIGEDQQAMVFLQLTQNPLGLHMQVEEIEAVLLLSENQNPPYPLVKTAANFFTGLGEGKSLHTYQLKVTSSWGILTSQAIIIPQKIDIDSLRITAHPSARKNVKVFFQDPEGVNYYALKALFFDAEDNQLEEFAPTLLFYPSQVFDDILAVDGKMECDIPVYAYNFNINELHRVEVILFHLEPNTWFYFDSLREAEGSLSDFWTEPTIVHSNMSHGLGVFGGFATDTLSVIVKHPNIP